MQRRTDALCSWKVAILIAILGTAGCPGTSEEEVTDGGPDSCAASQASGIWLLPFGPISQDLRIGGQSRVTVVVMQGSKEAQGNWAAQANQSINFVIITQGGDAKLQAGKAATDQDGLASMTFSSGTKEMIYQVQASTTGTCPTTFTIDVRKPILQLRSLTPNPFDTFTSSRVPLTVEATTDSNGKLADEEIQFRVTLGQTSETKLAPPTGGGATTGILKLKTNASGRATVMLTTGSQAIPQLKVEAKMAGTAAVDLVVRISKGTNSGCKDDTDCPLGYSCKSGACQPPPVTPPSGCKTNSDCAAPTICQVSTGKCLQSSGKTCDPIEGTGCDSGEICIGRQCAKLPTGCTDNSACPAGWICKSGTCVPGGQPPTGGCKTKKDCPANNTCINGSCVPKSACNITHKVDRLKGTWQYDSTLHFRQALGSVLKVILTTAGVLRDIIEGKFKISGIPSFISSLVSKYLKKLINQYVPPWGQQLVIALGDINDIVDDMRVLSTVQTTSVGNDSYVNSEQWTLVEFDYKGKKLSTAPSAVPQIGQIKIPSYGSSEVCGVLFINKHKVKNAVGGLVKWAINTALSVVTCSVKSLPCYSSVDQALQTTINCMMLGMQLDQMVRSIWSSAPSVANLVNQACEAEKKKLISKLNQELNSLTTKLSLLELSGTVKIPNPGSDTTLSKGKWYGVLGSSVAKGNFEGEFKATKQP